MSKDSFRIEIPISALKNLTRNQALAFLLWWFGLPYSRAAEIMHADISTYSEFLKPRKNRRGKGAFEKLGIDPQKRIMSPLHKPKLGVYTVYIVPNK